MQPVFVEPVHPGQGRQFELVNGPKWPIDFHALGFVEPDDRFGEGVDAPMKLLYLVNPQFFG